MRETHLSLLQLGAIAGTRAMAGAGLGMLLANRLSDRTRKLVGWTFLAVGALSTVPLAMEVLRSTRSDDQADWADYRPDFARARSG
jgi:hypothetical protein